MAVDWRMGLVQQDAGQSFTQGLQQGMQDRAGRDERNALAAYATNPNDPAAMAAIVQRNPEMAMKLQQQRAQQGQAQMEQRRADLPMLDRLVSSIRDQPSYDRAKQIAGQYGMDTSQFPPEYDPQQVAEFHDTIKLLATPQGQEALSTAGKQAVDMGYKPGTPEFNRAVHDLWQAGEAKPYVVGGETRLYQPKIGGVGQTVGQDVQEGATATNPQTGEKVQFRGGQWVPMGTAVTGGQTARPSGTFRPGFSGLPGESVTSTFRNPAHNKRVGGVSNSFHMSRWPDGTPKARDSVPPPGMSMSAYAEQLRRLNPDKDVINEGDHVHMEPRG